jgi:WD40 repeat protein
MRSVPSKVNNDIRAGWDLKMLEKKKLHNDAVSGCSLLFHVAGSYLTTVSLDGTLLVNTITFPSTLASPYSAAEDLRRGFTGTLSRFYASGPPQVEKVQSTLSAYRSHTASDPLACLSVTDDGYGGHLVFAGGHDDVVLAYGINSACAVASVYSHRDAVTGLDVIARSPLVQTSSLWSDMATHIMVSGSWDATVKVWSVAVSAGETVSINREPLAELFDADSTIVCLSATYVPGTGVGICTGCSDGSFVVWLIHDDGTKVVIHKEPSRRGAGPCAAVKWTKDQGETFLFAGFSNGRLSSFLLAGGNLIKVSAVSVGVSVTCLEYAQDTLLVGCADGGLRLLPIRDGASFDGKPTLWNAVNGLTSPGLVCCSIGFHDGRFLCSTGAEDGSVATFEL